MKVTDEDRKYESQKDSDTDEKDRRDGEDDITSIKTKAKRLLYTPKHSSKKQENNKQIN